MKERKKITRLALYLTTLFCLALAVGVYWFNSQKSTLPNITLSELSRYNGTNQDLPVYLALDGFVYDVSPGRTDFYNPGKPYHYLAGRDSSADLHVAGGTIIKMKYKIVGYLKP